MQGRLLPQFLGIGSMRCGTSWLHAMLSQHPMIAMAQPKQPNYFDKNCLQYGVEGYLKHWQHNRSAGHVNDGDVVPLSAQSIRGEISTGYGKLPMPAIRRIREALGDVAIILSIREPIARMWSQILYERFYERNVAEPGESLSRILVHAERRRMHAYNDYAGMYRRWSAVFGADRVHVAVFDDLLASPERYLRAVLKHVGVDADIVPSTEHLQQPVLAMPAIHIPEIVQSWLAGLVGDSIEQMNAVMGGRLVAWREHQRGIEPLPRSWKTKRQVLRGLVRAIEWPLYMGQQWVQEQRRAARAGLYLAEFEDVRTSGQPMLFPQSRMELKAA